MRYPASEKAEIIQLVEQSHLPAKRTLDKLGIPHGNDDEPVSSKSLQGRIAKLEQFQAPRDGGRMNRINMDREARCKDRSKRRGEDRQA